MPPVPQELQITVVSNHLGGPLLAATGPAMEKR